MSEEESARYYCYACGTSVSLYGDAPPPVCEVCGTRESVLPFSDRRSQPGLDDPAAPANENAHHKTAGAPQPSRVPTVGSRRRPRSLAIVSIIIITLFGGGYVVGIGLLLSGAQEFTLSRLIVEPPESEGGIPWPGWASIGKMLLGELPPLDPNNLGGTIEVVEAQYWWSKLKTAGSLLVGPLFILGWIGVYIGREWGRVCLYVYAAAWLANKVIYLLLMGAEGVFKFSLAVGMAVLLVLVLRSKSWSAWIGSSRTVNADSMPASI